MVEERRRQRAFAVSGRGEERGRQKRTFSVCGKVGGGRERSLSVVEERRRQRAFAVSGRVEEETESVLCQW